AREKGPEPDRDEPDSRDRLERPRRDPALDLGAHENSDRRGENEREGRRREYQPLAAALRREEHRRELRLIADLRHEHREEDGPECSEHGASSAEVEEEEL